MVYFLLILFIICCVVAGVTEESQKRKNENKKGNSKLENLSENFITLPKNGEIFKKPKKTSKLSWFLLTITLIFIVGALIGCYLPSRIGLIVSMTSLGLFLIFLTASALSFALFDKISYEEKLKNYELKLLELKAQQEEDERMQKEEQRKIEESKAISNLKNGIKKDIKSIISEVAPNIENSDLRNVFGNFLSENLDKAYKWSVNLFISDFSRINSTSFMDYCNIYREQIKKYRKSKKDLTEAEGMVLNILEGAYLSSFFSIDYYNNANERLFTAPIQCFQRLKLSLGNDFSESELTIFDDILDYYEEILEFKDAMKESEIMKNLSDLGFYILLQHQLMRLRAEKVNKFSEEHSLLELNFDSTLKFFEENNFSKEETTDYMTMVFGKYGITSFVCEEHKLKYIIDDGLSFMNLNFDYEISTSEKVESYFEKQRKKRYITRLAKGEINKPTTTITDIDLMSGFEFEKFISGLFQKMGYKSHTTKESGDQGIDVIAEKQDVKIAIQCKCYNGVVGNHAIMEAVAGAKYYDANKVMVVTNSTFTKSAIELASKNNVQLWDRKTLIEKMEEVL